MKFIVGEMSN